MLACVADATPPPVTNGSPESAVASLALPSDLEATLFAAELLPSSPSDIDVDASGRVWLCEVTNYRGKANTRPDGDRILVLEDTDGDGKADKQTVFHQGRDVDSALGICVIGEGPGRKVVVSWAPNVFVFHDDDGNKGVRINFVMEYGNYGYVDERTGAGWQSPRTNIEAEMPIRNWHQNDPGVVPNLLQTGGGSPTGICVYEGTLLPERFRGSLIHCDAGPGVVRAYHVKPQGAGFPAESETVVDGSADFRNGYRWFRPSDVCVAPYGSLIVADWHDPIVGGHGMG
ncbi:MAG: hypothetical protein WCJ18_10400, partial [Planctomycetota bacterium]